MRTTTMQEIREIAAVHGIGDLPVVTVDSVRVEPCREIFGRWMSPSATSGFCPPVPRTR